MINITDKTKCSGCTACYSICPHHAIEMVPDYEGFVYPEVDASKCTDCGACVKVCPILFDGTNKGYDTKFFIARAKSENVLNSSTSGGFVTPIAEYVFENKGVVCGVAFDNEFVVKHKIYDSCDADFNAEKALAEMRGSKYVQSDLGDIFVSLEQHIKSGRKVLFVGAPCQVAGLKAFLRQDYDNLITIDFVCHGVPSPKLWTRYKNYQKRKYKSEIKNISFRSKVYGYHKTTMKIVFENSKIYIGSPRTDLMLRSFFKEICSRHSCYNCKFKGIERCSDFTIYDCWRPDKLIDGFVDDDLGYTNIIFQSSQALNIFDKIEKKYVVYEITRQKFIEQIDDMVIKSATPHKKRNQYYSVLDEDALDCLGKKLLKITLKDKIIESVKIVLYKLGIIQYFLGETQRKY